MIGFLNVFKPAGPTSHDVVAAVRRRLPRGVKVGHCGTLDPFAEGVLVVCVGQATRLASYVQQQPKRYLSQVTLGASSTTDDPTGTITPGSAYRQSSSSGCHGPTSAEDRAPATRPPANDACGRGTAVETPGPGGTLASARPSEKQVRSAVARFVGEIRQRPPAHSAVHVEGQRAYKLARRGQDVEIPDRIVNVYAIEVTRYEYPILELDIRCGGGTYVRALARDIGTALGTAGYCSRLIRTEIGAFHADAALRPDAALRLGDLDMSKHLIAPVHALGEMPRIVLSDSDCARIRMGQSIDIAPSFVIPPSSSQCAALDPRGNLLAIVETQAARGVLRPRIVLSG